MEKFVTEVGGAVAFASFLCMACIGSQFLIGVLIGVAVAGFGLLFLDE